MRQKILKKLNPKKKGVGHEQKKRNSTRTSYCPVFAI